VEVEMMPTATPTAAPPTIFEEIRRHSSADELGSIMSARSGWFHGGRRKKLWLAGALVFLAVLLVIIFATAREE
jgi:hypothetical protein